MGRAGRVVRGVKAGTVAATGVALSFFVLDVLTVQPLASPGALSGAVVGPTGFELDLASYSGVIATVSMAYRLAMFTALHFLAFGFVGVLTSILFDWKSLAGLRRLLAVAILCTAAFYGTAALAGSGVLVQSLQLWAVLAVNLLAATLIVGYLHLANVRDPERAPKN